MKRPLHLRGGHGEFGVTLGELEQIVADAKDLGYDPDHTRLCSSPERPKGLIDIYLIEE